jgi:ADP-ribose pyrophosphatase
MGERTVDSRRVYSGRLLTLRVDQVELGSGRRSEREVIEHPGAVGILAWDGTRLAMVRQWRSAAGATLLEIPAGTREPDEEPDLTARRELAEEAQVEAGGWVTGPTFFTAPGFCTERLTLYLATDLAPARAEQPDDEEIEMSWLTLDEALAGIDEGTIVDAKSVAGILWLARRLSGTDPDAR